MLVSTVRLQAAVNKHLFSGRFWKHQKYKKLDNAHTEYLKQEMLMNKELAEGISTEKVRTLCTAWYI